MVLRYVFVETDTVCSRIIVREGSSTSRPKHEWELKDAPVMFMEYAQDDYHRTDLWRVNFLLFALHTWRRFVNVVLDEGKELFRDGTTGIRYAHRDR